MQELVATGHFFIVEFSSGMQDYKSIYVHIIIHNMTIYSNTTAFRIEVQVLSRFFDTDYTKKQDF